MKRFALIFLALFLVPGPAHAVTMSGKKGKAGSVTTVGVMRGLVFHAPLNDPANPVIVGKGTGSFTFTRAHDATHTATFVHPTTGYITESSNNVLRVESRGALIENTRTNMLTYSAALDHANWTKEELTPTADSTTSPDGGTNAEKMMETAVTSLHRAYQTPTFANLTAYTASVFVKANGRDVGRLSVQGALTEFAVVEFRLSDQYTNRPVGSASSITSYGNGWYKLTVSGTSGATDAGGGATVLAIGDDGFAWNHAGDVAKGMYIWGFGLEVGLYPTSYIPTVAASMIRNVDLLTIPSTGNLTANSTVAFHGNVDEGVAATSRAFLANNWSDYGVMLLGTDITYRAIIGTAHLAPVTTAAPTYTGFVTNNVTRYFVMGGGTPMGVGTATTVTGNIEVGAAGASSQLDGHIKDIYIWGRSLSDDEMKQISY